MYVSHSVRNDSRTSNLFEAKAGFTSTLDAIRCRCPAPFLRVGHLSEVARLFKRAMKKQIKTVLTLAVAFLKETMESYIVLVLFEPIQSQKQLFKLIIKSPV